MLLPPPSPSPLLPLCLLAHKVFDRHSRRAKHLPVRQKSRQRVQTVLSACVSKPLARSTVTTVYDLPRAIPTYVPVLGSLLTLIDVSYSYNSLLCVFFLRSTFSRHREEMTIKAATTTAVVATAATPRRRRASGFARMAAFLLVASVVLADVIRVCEYRYYGLFIIIIRFTES